MHNTSIIRVFLFRRKEHILFIFLTFMGPSIVSIFQYIYPTRCNVTQFIYIWKQLYMFRVVPLPIIRSALTFMGPCIVSIFQYISTKMQRYTVYLYLETALHVSGGTSTHHQERIKVYGSVHCKYIPTYIQQDATLHSLFRSKNCSTCFGWYYHPSSGAQTTVSTASGICHTVTATCPIAAGSSIGVTNARCCRYSCMRSWCRVEVPPETCRAVFR